MTGKEYIQWRIDTGDRFLVNIHKHDRDLLASILEQYAALRQPPVVGQSELLLAFSEFVKKHNEVTVTINEYDVKGFLSQQ